MTEEELHAIEARNEKAQAEVSALCKGKHWLMTIPADRNRDSDLIIAAALADSRALLAEAQRLRAALGVAEVNAAAIRDALIHGLGLANELGEGERWATWRLTAHTALSGEPTP